MYIYHLAQCSISKVLPPSSNSIASAMADRRKSRTICENLRVIAMNFVRMSLVLPKMPLRERHRDVPPRERVEVLAAAAVQPPAAQPMAGILHVEPEIRRTTTYVMEPAAVTGGGGGGGSGTTDALAVEYIRKVHERNRAAHSGAASPTIIPPPRLSIKHSTR